MCSNSSDARFVIREAEVADASALVDYVNAVSGETDNLAFGTGEFGMTVAEEERYLKALRESPNQLYLLALVGKEITGGLSFTASHRPRLRHSGEFGLSVRRRYWRHGIGTALVDELVRWARVGGVVRKLNLKVQTGNTAAIQLYLKKGFQFEGRSTKDALINGMYRDHYLMGLFLD